MYAAPFEYHAPTSVAEALALLDRLGGEAKIIAGGQSLVPLMKLRLAQPAHLVDLRKVPGLTSIGESGATLQIGALATHDALSRSPVVRAKFPMMAEAAAQIGDAQVRNLGTIGGSLAHADPAADWPAVLLSLDASVQVISARGERTLKVDQLIAGPLSTVLTTGEILTQVRVPLPGGRSGGAYEKLPHPASRFAIVGAAVALQLDASGAVQSARIALTGLAPKVTRAGYVERALQGKTADAARTAAGHAAEGIDLRADLIGSAAYRANLAAVYTERAIKRAFARALER